MSVRRAEQIGDASSLDWSGIVIGYCKAVELETLNRIIEPVRVAVAQTALPVSDLEDNDIGRIALYCAGRIEKPPELGAIPSLPDDGGAQQEASCHKPADAGIS